jgi:hypothetical protein
MAKSLRSKSKKKFRTLKRTDSVFAVAEKERLERLAKKLKLEEEAVMEISKEVVVLESTPVEPETKDIEKMDISTPATASMVSTSKKLKRTQKDKKFKKRRGPRTTF